MRTLAIDTSKNVGKTVTVAGWVDARRSHGKLVFLDLRDRSGTVQLVFQKAVGDPRPEDIIEIVGTVKTRPESMINSKLPTGTVEVEVSTLTILSKSKELPFPIDTDGYDINEEIRLKYRYLDLRRPRIARNIRLRSVFVDLVRQFLFSQGFTEIETPLLTKSTPEGSRDFLVPSRLQPGEFYALPQSPQQYKQLLMVAGFERYFQIARCLRDEDLRADRGFEHSQVDIEMSFVTREEVMALDEAMMISVVEKMGYTIKQKPFPVFTYAEAMEKFGADKFDLRTEEDKKNGVLAYAWVIDFPFFEKTDDGGWTFTHNPFSAPKPEFKSALLAKEHIESILTSQYDLVCNGLEVGGGSIRSHEPEVLESVFEIMGYTKDKIREQFGHMLEAFSYGAPPHGGLAHGIERNLMALLSEKYLRDVVAFPQTSSGQASVMDAPSRVTEKQLREVGLASKQPAARSDVYGQIVALLREENISFSEYKHEPVLTSEDAARVRNTPLHEGAKALVLFGDGKPLMVVLPADLKADTKKLKDILHIKDLRMATKEEVKEVTGVEVGAVPPFGNLFHIPLYVDISLQENEQIVFNAGSHTMSIRMRENDFERVVHPVVGEYSKT